MSPIVSPKRCTRCEQEKPATSDYFYRRYDGWSHRCKDCIALARGSKRRRSAYFNAPDGSKRCITCEEFIPLEKFCKRADRPDGLNNECRACASKRHKVWYIENRDEAVERAANWSDANLDRVRANHRRWSSKNNEKLNVYVHRRLARKHSLPFNFSIIDWQRCLNYWDHQCCICGQRESFWHTLAKEHWIPLKDKRPDNPGTVAWNILPMCHAKKDGEMGCNNSKGSRDPAEWLIERFGKRKARVILKRIEAYFEWVKQFETA